MNSKTPFDDLSGMTILFFLTHTDFCEPSIGGFGFSSELNRELIKSAKKKIKDGWWSLEKPVKEYEAKYGVVL